jgi:carbon monoxide dehydrogenase subunit G
MRTESSTSIERPVNAVFDYVSDMSNDPEWHTDMLEVRASGAGPIGVGTIFDLKFKPFMGQSQGKATISEFQSGKRVVLKGQMGKFAPTITLAFEPSGSGTRVTRTVDMVPPGLMRVMSPIMKSMMSKQNAGFLANLKRLLESR